MKKYSINELRELYLSFFESKEHLRLPSFSLVPKNDKSLLLINSGMAPLKPYFTGQEIPPSKRVTTCQKCIRTGDIENIGYTARHGTFFEMLGNFSFGDYFKKEAITWSWEFLTMTLGLDKDRLYPSVYQDDNEAYDLWHEYIGIPSERIFKFGKKDNFWEHGEGPCGPCSEIYYDRGEKYGCKKPDCTVGCDCDRFIEVWNNVFTQFSNDGKGNYTELKQKNIDTGMGLERLGVVCQDVESIFEVDTNKDLMDEISIVTRHIYKDDSKDDISLRIIADHIKSCTFMISDGIMPSNEGRGYVLRRLLRRAVRHGRLLGVNKSFMSDLAKVVIKLNKEHYTELIDKKDFILNILNTEENKFNQTIDQGLEILNTYIDDLKKSNVKTLSGENCFKLYDTYGFPLDLTKEILMENNYKIDEDKFNELMNNQKNTARNARKITNYMGADETIFNKLDNKIVSEFIGYDKLEALGNIKAIISNNNIVEKINEQDEAIIITDKTPFYPTMGGQTGDVGKIVVGNSEFEVYDTFKILNVKIGHLGKVVKGSFKVSDDVKMCIDENTRHKISINHTATHLLQAALRKVLGNHVEQAGSSVESNKLRFDFTSFEAMTKEQKNEVEEIVNDIISQNIVLKKQEMPLEEAKKLGAMALFGEKYSDVVRTVKINNFSFELCGGTHIENTGEIRLFKILSEQGISSGVRRIEAITSEEVIKYYKELENKLNSICTILKTNEVDVINKVENVLEENKKLKNKNSQSKNSGIIDKVNDIKAVNISDLDVIVEKFENVESDSLKNLIDSLKDKYKNYFIVVFSINNSMCNIISAMSDFAIEKGFSAGSIIKETSKILSGNGGGKNKFAEGMGKDIDKIDTIMKKIIEDVKAI